MDVAGDVQCDATDAGKTVGGKGRGGDTMDVARDVQRGATDAGRAAPRLQPVALHGRDQAQRCVGHLVHLLAKIQPVGEAV